MNYTLLPKQLCTKKFTYSSEKSVEELSRKLQGIVNDKSLSRIDDQFKGEMITPNKFELYLPKVDTWV